MHLHRKRTFLEESMLISKECAYSQGELVLEVVVQQGPSALVGEGRLYLKGASEYGMMVFFDHIYYCKFDWLC